MTLFCPWQTVAVDTVKAAGWAGRGLTVIANVLAVLVPQPFVAVTERVPDVAVAEKLILTEFELPVIVSPVPL